MKFIILTSASSDIRHLATFVFFYLLCLLATLRSGPEEIRWHLYTDETLSGAADSSKAFIRQMLALRKFFEWMTFIVGALVASEYIYNNPTAWEMFSIAFNEGQKITD